MMKDKHISDKNFILTAVIGSLLVMALVIGTTLWASNETASEAYSGKGNCTSTLGAT